MIYRSLFRALRAFIWPIIPMGWLWTCFVSKLNTRVRKFKFMKKSRFFFTTQYMCSYTWSRRWELSFDTWTTKIRWITQKLFKNLYSRATQNVKMLFCHKKKKWEIKTLYRSLFCMLRASIWAIIHLNSSWFENPPHPHPPNPENHDSLSAPWVAPMNRA